MEHSRRQFIKSGAILTTGAMAISPFANAAVSEIISLLPTQGLFELPPLGYALNALEPYIDAQTMQIHHNKHHLGYVTKLNDAIGREPSAKNQSLESLLNNLKGLPEESREAIRNNGGGHWNHSFFWTILQKNTSPSEKMTSAINENFGSMAAFKKAFEKAATGVFGSGWAWVIKDKKG
jgi:superoxide dismutase, Fe-Mn family